MRAARTRRGVRHRAPGAQPGPSTRRTGTRQTETPPQEALSTSGGGQAGQGGRSRPPSCGRAECGKNEANGKRLGPQPPTGQTPRLRTGGQQAGRGTAGAAGPDARGRRAGETPGGRAAPQPPPGARPRAEPGAAGGRPGCPPRGRGPVVAGPGGSAGQNAGLPSGYRGIGRHPRRPSETRRGRPSFRMPEALRPGAAPASGAAVPRSAWTGLSGAGWGDSCPPAYSSIVSASTVTDIVIPPASCISASTSAIARSARKWPGRLISGSTRRALSRS